MRLVIPDVFHVQEPVQVIMHAGPPLTVNPGCSMYRSGDRFLVVDRSGMSVYEIPMMNVLGMAREGSIEEAQALVVEHFHDLRKPPNMH